MQHSKIQADIERIKGWLNRNAHKAGTAFYEMKKLDLDYYEKQLKAL